VKIAFYSLIAGLALFFLSSHTGVQSRLLTKSAGPSAASWKRIDNKGAAKVRRLESVTWDSVKHQLSWDVSRGEKDGDGYKANGNDRYAINMDSATMTVNGQSRKFSVQEAANVRTLMDFISKYALESTLWWENGEGDPADGNGAPQNPDRQPDNREKEGAVGSKALRIVNLQIPAIE
jgi:hypothetical protein